MIKAIFFDFDGVLTTHRSGSYTTYRYLHNRLGIPLEQVQRCYKAHSLQWVLGKLSLEEFWSAMSKCGGLSFGIRLFNEAFISTPINKPLLEVVKKLREKYKVGIITDNAKERMEAIKEHFKLGEYFDTIVVSGETGVLKNNKLAFATALNKLGVKAEECVFIDNRIENLMIPREMGFVTIHYDASAEQDIVVLDKKLRTLEIEL